MKHLDGILDMVDKELGSIEKNGQFRSREEVHSVYELMDIAKDIFCVWKYMEGEDGESYAYEYDRGGSYERGRNYAYDGGESYARRGRGRNARRDRMGRYSSEYNRENYRRDGYSRDDAKEEYTEKLRRLMEEAPDSETRMGIQRMIDHMD